MTELRSLRSGMVEGLICWSCDDLGWRPEEDVEGKEEEIWASLRRVCLQRRIFGSYSKTVLSERKTKTEESGRSFIDLTTTLEAVVGSKDSPEAENKVDYALRCLRISAIEQVYSMLQVSKERWKLVAKSAKIFTLYRERFPLSVRTAKVIASSFVSMKQIPSIIIPYLIYKI
jgi:hypothetical protein